MILVKGPNVGPKSHLLKRERDLTQARTRRYKDRGREEKKGAPALAKECWQPPKAGRDKQ